MKLKRTTTIFIFLLFLLIESAVQTDSSTIKQTLESYFSRFSSFGFSFSVLVDNNRKILHHGIYDPLRTNGFTNQTLFDIASVSKQFTAAAIMVLKDNGKLNVKDSISKHIRNVPESMKSVTIHHLLTHSSGIIDDYDLYEARPVLTRDNFLQELFRRPLGFEPGTQMEYSNDGYALLATIVEFVSRQPFEKFARDNLFLRSSMPLSGFIGEPERNRKTPPSTGGAYAEITRSRSWSCSLGGGSILSNVLELRNWDEALKSGEIISVSSLEEIWKPHIKGPANLQYGYGWWIRETERKTRLIFHSGRNETGFNSWNSIYPDENLTIIFTSNMDFAGQSLRESFFSATGTGNIERILYGYPFIMPPDSISMKNSNSYIYEGLYKLATGGWLEVQPDGDSLHIVPHGQDAFDLFLPNPLQGQDQNYEAVGIDLKWNDLDRKQLRDATSKSIEVFEALRLGDVKIYAEAIGEKPEEIKTELLGSFQAFEVLGTTPLARRKSGMEMITIVWIWQQQIRKEYFVIWQSGVLDQIFPGSDPFPIPRFRKTAGNRFVNFHPFLHGSVSLEFVTASGGVEKLIVDTPTDLVTAWK